MFMRVNSKCAHQVGPPRGRIQLSAVVEETLGDYSLPLPEARQNVRLRGLFSRGGQPVLPNSDQCLCGDFARDLGVCQTQLGGVHGQDTDKGRRVGLELAIFALIPGLGNVAERPASDLR